MARLLIGMTGSHDFMISYYISVLFQSSFLSNSISSLYNHVFSKPGLSLFALQVFLIEVLKWSKVVFLTWNDLNWKSPTRFLRDKEKTKREDRQRSAQTGEIAYDDNFCFTVIFATTLILLNKNAERPNKSMEN